MSPDTGLDPAQTRYRTRLDDTDESSFREWYKLYSGNTRLDSDPDNPRLAYDYRGWYQAMRSDPVRYSARADESGRLTAPPEFKDDDNPTRFEDGIDTRSGQPASFPTPPSVKRPSDKQLTDPLGLFERRAEPQDAGALDTLGIGVSNIVPRWKQSGAGMMVSIGESRAGKRTPMDLLREIGRDRAEAVAKGGFFPVFMQKATEKLKLISYVTSGGPVTAGVYALLSPEQQAKVDTAKADLALIGRRLFTAAEKEITPIPKEVLMTAWGYEVKNPSYYVATALEAGIGTMAPGFVVGYLAKSPAAALGVMSTQVYGSQYEQSRRDGRSPGEATVDAIFYGATEGLSELIPFRVFLGKTTGLRELIRKTFKGTLTEGGQEVLNEAAQAGYEAGILKKDMTWREFVSRLIDAGIIGGIMGFGFGAMPGSVEGEAAEPPPTAPPPPTPEEQAAAAADQGIPYEPGVVPEGVPPSRERVELDEDRVRFAAEQARTAQAQAAADAEATKPPTSESEAGKLLQRAEDIKRAISESETVELTAESPIIGELSQIYARLDELGISPDQANQVGPQGPQPLEAGVEGPGEAERRVESQGRIREQEKRLGPRPLPPNFDDKRLSREQHRLSLGDMADDLTIGGGGAGALIYDEKGNVTGRLPSINPDWFQAMNEQAETKTTVEETEAAVQKALDGEKLGVRQARIVGAMLDNITEARGGQVDHAKAQLEAARAERKALRSGFPPLAIYDEAADRAGEIYAEDAYEADWDGETRAMSEIAREALEADETRAEAILESQGSDADVARRLTALIAEVQGGEAQPTEAEPGAEPVQPDQGPAQEGQGEGLQTGETQTAQVGPEDIDAKLEKVRGQLKTVEASIAKRRANDRLATLHQMKLQNELRDRINDLLGEKRLAEQQPAAPEKAEDPEDAVQLPTVPGVRRDGEQGPEGAEGLEGGLPGGEEAPGQEGQPATGPEQPEVQQQPQDQQPPNVGPLSQTEIDAAVRRIATLTEGAEPTIVAAIAKLASNTDLAKIAAEAGWGKMGGSSSPADRWSVEGRGTTVTVSLPGQEKVTFSGAKLGAKIRELFGPKPAPGVEPAIIPESVEARLRAAYTGESTVAPDAQHSQGKYQRGQIVQNKQKKKEFGVIRGFVNDRAFVFWDGDGEQFRDVDTLTIVRAAPLTPLPTTEPPGTGAQLLVTKFASGMTRPRDMRVGFETDAAIGIEVGELSNKQVENLGQIFAEAKNDKNPNLRLFIDSGAFGLFRASLRKGKEATMNWKEVFRRYNQIIDDAESTLADKGDVHDITLVMPDVVGDQAETLRLIQQHAGQIVELMQKGADIIIPFQSGPMDPAKLYATINDALRAEGSGNQTFGIGIPTNEVAMSDEQLGGFLKTVQPSRIHLLGAVRGPRFEARMKVLRNTLEAGGEYDITADAVVLRARLQDLRGLKGKEKEDKIAEILRDREAISVEATQPDLIAQADTKAEIDEKANEAATSPENELPEPTQEQKEAENYRVGDEITLAGNVKVKIENPKGSYRFKLDVERVVRIAAALEKAVVSDETETTARKPYVAKQQLAEARKLVAKALAGINDSSLIGSAFRALEAAATAIRNARLLELADVMDTTLDEGWVNLMRDHYGRILGTVGRDKDHVDIYLGSRAAQAAPGIFVIDQKNPATGKFDEHKVMWGYAGKDEAKAGYLANFDKGWKGFDAIREMTVDEFVEWVYDKAATKQRAWAWKPSLDIPEVKPARMAIGDYVVPVRDRDVLRAGTITHIKEVDGVQRIKLEQGGQYWYATDFAKATKPQTAAEYREAVVAKLPAMSDAQVTEAMDDPRTKKDPDLVERLRLVMESRLAPKRALTDLSAAMLEDGNALLRELMGEGIDLTTRSAKRTDMFIKHIRAWVKNEIAIAQAAGDVARIHGLGALVSADGKMKIDTEFYDSLGVELLKQAERIKRAEIAAGPKISSTGERLRRHWELSRNLADAANAKDANEFISDIEKATNRRTLFDVPLAEDATPGTRRWINAFRDKITPFKITVSRAGWRRRSFADHVKRLIERGDDLSDVRKDAKRYIDFVTRTAEIFEGAKTIDELAARLKKMAGGEAGSPGRKLWSALPFSGHLSDFNDPSRSWSIAGRLKVDEAKLDSEIEVAAKKKPLRRIKNDKTRRSGFKDHRKGKNMTGEDLKARFGFADVTYGNYVTVAQRQDHTNAAFDAFMDLAETLGIEPEQISLGGTMHLAFGALGHGRHAAHYQAQQPTESGPTVPVINLTNTRGDGTIAHEWTHALDFALRPGRTGRQHPAISRLVGLLRYRYDGGVEKLHARLARFLDGNTWYTGFRQKGSKASAEYWLKTLINNLKRGGGGSEFGQTSYASNAYKLGKDYWYNDEEMLARASEAWVYDTILAREAEDNYLVNGWVAEGAVGKPTYRGAPYPEGDERVLFAEVLKEFFDGLTFDENNNPTVSAELMEKMEARVKELLDEAESMLANLDTLAEEHRVEKLAKARLKAEAVKDAKAQAEAAIREKLKAELDAGEEGPDVSQPQTLEDELANMSDDDIDDMLDGVTAELEEKRQDPGPVEAPPPPSVGKAKFIEIAAARILSEFVMPKKMMRWQDLQTITDSAFGGTQAEGAYTIKDAYEAMEVAVNRYVASKYMVVGEGVNDKNAASNALAFLSKMMGLLPTQTRRTGEQVAFQQFSTPPHIAMLTAYAGNLTSDDVMLEPSAGTGSIALWGTVVGAETIVNEITEVRAALLRQEGFDTVMAEDAEHINNLLSKRPTIVLMNPPFSAAGHKGLTSTEIITRHIDAALKALAPGGRAVIISGRGLEAGKARFRKWWKKIEGEYNVLANLSIDGSTYRKYGTTFDVQLIVIDKTGPTVNTATIERTADLGVVLDAIEDIRNARREADTTVQRPAAEPGGEAAAGEGGGAAVPELPLQPPTDDLGPGGEPARPGAGEAGRGTEGEAGAGGERPGVGGAGVRNEVPGVQRPGGQRAPGGAAGDAPGGGAGTPTGGAPATPGAEPDLPVGDKAAQVRALSKKFAEHGVKGTSKTLEGLVELFGGKGTLKSFPAGLDPESYAKAKPLFKEALAEFYEAGKTMRELSMVLLEFFGEGLRPLLKQYARDLRESRATPVINVPSETPQEPDQPKVVTVEAKKDTEELSDDIFNHYQPTLTLPGAKPHPGDLVESAAMAMVDSPATSYVPNLPPELVESGALSDAQVEAAILAGAAHDQLLPPDDNGIEYRKGFLVGDGTGVGKGREIGAIILDNMRRGNGNGKAVWISKNNDLLKDARRDWGGIGQVKEALFPLAKTKTGGNVTAKKGILYTTYSTLGSSYGASLKAAAKAPAIATPKVGDRIKFTATTVQGQRFAPPPLTVVEVKGNQYRVDVRSSDAFGWNPSLVLGEEAQSLWVPSVAIDEVMPAKAQPGFEKSRLDQIVEWLGEDFDGVIAMDEAHAMGNNIETKGKRGKKKPSMRALAGIDLQKRLPKARIVYVTATAATEVSNLGYMERLGLWGRGTAFTDKLDFITKIASAGVSAMEVAAQHMKAIGVAISRSLSYKDVTYGRLEHELTPEQRDQYNEIARAWQMVLADMTTAMADTDQDKNPNAKSRVTSAFWGAHQRFYSQVTTSMQMPTVLADAEEQLASGNSVVMQLVNTNEAVQEREIKRLQQAGLSLDEFDMTPRDTLLRMVEKVFPVIQMEATTDDNGNTVWVQATDSQGKPIINQAQVAKRDELLRKLASIRIPDGPLEMLINRFGPEAVAEVTGRSRRIVRDADTGKNVEEKLSDSTRERDVNAFLDGKKRILIFSDKGGTGRSYHADLDVKNQQKRMHYLLQPGWRADNALQGFGRTHRSNQAQAPHYILVMTDIKAQRRFVSSVARRLDQLGALTKGQRETGGQGIFGAEFNLENEYADGAVQSIMEDAVNGKLVDKGMPLDLFERQMGLAGLKDEATGGLNQGKVPKVPKFLNRLFSLELDEMNVVFDEFWERLEAAVEFAREAGTLDAGMENITAESVILEHDEQVWKSEETGAETRYMKIALTDPVRFNAFADIADMGLGVRVLQFFAKNVKSGRIYAFFDAKDMTDRSGIVRKRYRRVGVAGDGGFEQQREVRTSGYGNNYERIEDMTEVRRLWDEQIAEHPKTKTVSRNLIVGSVLSVWDRLAGDTRMYRAQLDDGTRIIGRLIPEKHLKQTLKRLGAEGSKISVKPEQMIANLKSGQATRYTLANDWSITAQRVANETRIELHGPGSSERDQIKADGVIEELISYRNRYFIPNADVMARVIKYRPVVDQATPDSVAEPTTTYSAGKTLGSPSPSADLKTTVWVREDGTVDEAMLKKHANMGTKVRMVQTGTFRTGITQVNSIEDVAHVVAQLRKEPQESMMAVVLGENNVVLGIIRHSIGGIGASTVQTSILLGAVNAVEGAKSVYFVHNHPSGIPTQSQADRLMTDRLLNALARTGIEGVGMIVVAPNSRDATFYREKGGEFAFTITAARRTGEVPVLERRFQSVRGQGLKGVSNPTEMRLIAKKLLPRGKDGVLLLDHRHGIVGVVPMSISQMAKLRTSQTGTGASALLKAIHETNAANMAVVVAGSINRYEEQAAKNVGAFGQNVGIGVLDILVYQPGTDSFLKSMAETGDNMVGEASNGGFYLSRGDAVKGSTVSQVEKAIAPILKRWKRHPEIIVVQSAADLPADLQRQIAAEPGEGAVKGAFFDGRAYLIADSIASKTDARVILAHEVVGHFSMQEMLGEQGFKDIVREVQRLKAAGDKTIAKLAAEVLRGWGNLDETAEVSEILAILAEKRALEGPSAAVLRKARSLFRAFLKRLGFQQLFSTTDIDSLITQAAVRLRTGTATLVQRPEPARAPQARTTTFMRWFRQSKVLDAVGRPKIVYHATTADFKEFGEHPERPDIGFHFGSLAQMQAIIERAASNEVSEGLGVEELLLDSIGPGPPKLGPIVHPQGVTRPRGEPEAVATGANVMPVYIRIESPLRMNDVFGAAAFADVAAEIERAGVKLPRSPEEYFDGYADESRGLDPVETAQAKWNEMMQAIESAGYDGIVYENRHEGVKNTEPLESLPAEYEVKLHAESNLWFVADPEGNAIGRFTTSPEEAAASALRVLRPGNDSYIVFRQEQIKSATGNIGTYGEVTDITLSRSRRATQNRARLSRKEKDEPETPKYPGGIDWTPTPEPRAGADAPTAADTKAVEAADADEADNIRDQARGAFSRLRDRANSIVDRMNERLHPLHGLEDRKAYMQDRYLALGKIAESQVFAKQVYETFKKASAADSVAIYDYLTDAENDGSAISDEAMRREARGVKQLINTVGKMLVEHGIIPLESYEHYQGRYLPRLYLYYLMGDKAINAIGTGKLMSERGYAKKRNEELPQEFRDVFLGEVKDPAFLASKALGIPMRDIALMEWFETIAENTTWVLPKQFVKWRAPGFDRARKVTPYWLKSEASKLRTRAEQYTDPELKEQALSVAANMDEKADKALVDAELNADIVPEGYKRMPMTSRLGTLRGMVVRSHVYEDVMGAAHVLADDASMAERILGFGGIGTKITQIWKWSKVAANPPAQVRNLVSNWILLNLSGVPLRKLPKLLGRALKEIRTKGRYYKIGVRHGITESTFAANELFRIEREMLQLQMKTRGSFSLLHIKNMAAMVVEWTGDRYQDAEMWSKLAKIMYEMEVNGKTEGEAAMEAQEWLFDYSLVGKNTRYLRNAPIGAPFLTFYLKVLPRILETAINHPQRFLPYVALIYGSQLLAAALSGGDPDDFKRLKKALPDWIQRKGSVMFLPVKDEHDRWQVVDIGYMLPWTMWTELAGTTVKTGLGVVKGEGFGELGNLLTLSGLLGGPIPDLMAAVLTGKDSFTGRQIVEPLDPAGEQFHALITYLVNMAVPSFLAGIPPFHEHATYRGAGGHFYESVTGAVDRYGQPKSTVPQALARFVGVNIYPMEPARTRAQNMRRRMLDIRETQRRMTTRLNDANLAGDDAAAIRKAYTKKIRNMQREAAQYAEDSRLSPATR